MRYLSVCSGIEAATVAWHPLGWQPVAFAEIDPFASALLAHYYPDVPNLGDMEAHSAWRLSAFDVLVGGTPCQSFSVAGLRGGMADPRGNLALVYLAIADQFRPEWVVWENVPGVLSSNGGRDFGAFLGAMVELGYGFAYRVLDAQYFGVPQRRRRVFVVGCLGGWQRAAAVLFERASLSGNPPPRREAGAAVARCVTRGSDSGQRYDSETETFVTHTLRAEGYDASEDGTGRGVPLTVSTLRANSGRNQIEGPYVPELADPVTANEGRTYCNAGNNPRLHNVVACFDETQITSPENRSLARPDTAALAAHARPPSIALSGGRNYAHATETGPIEALRALRESVDEETLCQWCLGILAAFWPQEVLRPEVYGGRIRCASQPKRGLVHVALSCSQDGAGWTVRDLWEAGCTGRPSQGWRPHEQLAQQLGAYLSKLPYAPSPAERFMRDLWQACEGARVLRQTLSAVQDARRSSCGESESAQPAQVRRLTVEECEALQGFPRSYTLIPYRGKPASDSARYKALGNSMAVPVMRWIGERIQMVNRRMPAFLRSQAG